VPRPKKKKPQDEVRPEPGWGRKDFFRDLNKVIHGEDKPPKKKRG
jgi:hypothetical protein